MAFLAAARAGGGIAVPERRLETLWKLGAAGGGTAPTPGPHLSDRERISVPLLYAEVYDHETLLSRTILDCWPLGETGLDGQQTMPGRHGNGGPFPPGHCHAAGGS